MAAASFQDEIVPTMWLDVYGPIEAAQEANEFLQTQLPYVFEIRHHDADELKVVLVCKDDEREWVKDYDYFTGVSTFKAENLPISSIIVITGDHHPVRTAWSFMHNSIFTDRAIACGKDKMSVVKGIANVLGIHPRTNGIMRTGEFSKMDRACMNQQIQLGVAELKWRQQSQSEWLKLDRPVRPDPQEKKEPEA